MPHSQLRVAVSAKDQYHDAVIGFTEHYHSAYGAYLGTVSLLTCH